MGAKPSRGVEGALAAMAENDDAVVVVVGSFEGCEIIGNVAERDEFGAFYGGCLILPGLANVNEKDIFAGVELLFHFLGSDFDSGENIVGILRHGVIPFPFIGCF